MPKPPQRGPRHGRAFAGVASRNVWPFRRRGRSARKFRSKSSSSRLVMARAFSMSRRRANISASLQAHRALLLAEGRRRFYVHPLDVGPYSRLGRVAHDSPADCIAAAHLWLQRARSDLSWWFRIVERAELPGQSVHASVQDVLVFSDLLPLRSFGGSHSIPGAARPRESGESSASPETGTIKAFDGSGSPCKRQFVPRV